MRPGLGDIANEISLRGEEVPEAAGVAAKNSESLGPHPDDGVERRDEQEKVRPPPLNLLQAAGNLRASIRRRSVVEVGPGAAFRLPTAAAHLGGTPRILPGTLLRLTAYGRPMTSPSSDTQALL
jgi:hypothetical protein